MRDIYQPIDLVAEGLAVGERITDFIGRDVYVTVTLPPIIGTVMDTHVSDKTGRLWLHITDADGNDHEYTLGDVIFL